MSSSPVLFVSSTGGLGPNGTKERAVAAFAKQPLRVRQVTLARGATLSSIGTLPVLQVDGQETPVAQSYAIVRYLLASSPITAKVDDWLEFVQREVDVLAQAATLAALGGGPALGSSDTKTAGEAAVAALIHVLSTVVEAHLRTRTFLVGEVMSAADVVLACALLDVMRLVFGPRERRSLVATERWFKTVVAQESVLGVVGSIELCDESPTFESAVGASPAASDSTRGPHMGLLVEPKTKLFKRSRTRVKEILLSPDKGASMAGEQVVVCGWARTVRKQSATLIFIQLNDGSCFDSLQIVCSEATVGLDAVAKAGGIAASFKVTGEIVLSPAKGQVVDLVAAEVEVLGDIDPDAYPLKKTRTGHKVEFLRQHAHLRPRTNLIGAVTRVRNALAYATHRFFQEKGFAYIHTPILTASDCEGAGEMFQVTTLLQEDDKKEEEKKKEAPPAPDAKLTAGAKPGIDYKKDFFGKPTFLTVSGQLNVECFACALSDVYTFGPTFRAENSHTSRHLAEFWMVEPEICFATLDDNMNLAEDYVKFCTQYAMDYCMPDLEFLNKNVEKGLLARLMNVLDSSFVRLTYTDAIKVLNEPKHLKAGKFTEKPVWGIDMGSEHERYLTEKVYKGPVIVTDYPASFKAFYMRQNEPDEEGRLTVQAMDVLVPKIGELIGGAAREERLPKLEEAIIKQGNTVEDFDWYCDLRRYGSVPHAGFGLGFERLVLFVTGVENIRDVIPFPRVPNSCSY